MNNNFIEIEIDPNYIRFPILQNGEEVYAMKYPRNVILLSNSFYEDDTIHCIGYDNDNNIMIIIFHKKNDGLKKPPIEVDKEIHYFANVNKDVFNNFLNSENKTVYFNDNIKETKLVSLNNIKLIGEHNKSNILCAVLAVYLQTHNKEILKKISDFHGINHRIEFVKTINTISFFNDSKATNIDSTLVALRCFTKSIYLIMGGSDKGYEFDEFFKKIPNNIKFIAIFGETKEKIAFSAEKYKFFSYQKFNNLKECVMFCYKMAEKNSIVLLSPACASFDQFNNYEERGNVFKKIVREISSDETCINKIE